MYRLGDDIRTRKHIVCAAMSNARDTGHSFKDGAFEAIIAASIWVSSSNDFIEVVSRKMDEFRTPIGLEMPWGTFVKP